MSLTAKQKAFIQEYLVDLNATAAAGRAGYKDANIGRQLITKNNVSAAIKHAQSQREKRTNITQDWVLERLVKEAERSGKGSSHAARVSALALAMKHLGMMKEDGPHPDRKAVDLSQLTDDALDRILATVGPLLSPELRVLVGAGEGQETAPPPVE